MRLESLHISGYRSYNNGIQIEIEGELTAMVGRNDAGKSSVLEALDLFFSNGRPDEADFSVGETELISITCTFSDLPATLILDSSNETDLKEEYLLDSGKLTISKRWTRGRSSCNVFAICDHPSGSEIPTLLNEKQASLKSIASKLSISDSRIGDKRSNANYRKAIWSHLLQEKKISIIHTAVPLIAEDGKSVAKAIENYLPYFHLFKSDRQGTEADALAQDPAKAVIKSILESHSVQLDKLTEQIQSQISSVLRNVIEKLDEVAPDLASSLHPSESKPSWTSAFKGIQFIDENGIPLAKRGSGTRRLVLMSFFRAEAEKGLDDLDGYSQYHRGVITAVEEPETALHADLQTDILGSFMDVAELPHRQVLITTHSTNLIRKIPVEAVRYIRSSNGVRECIHALDSDGQDELIRHLNESLGVFTDHNVKCFVLVEGRHDIEALKALSKNLHTRNIPGIECLATLESQGLICFLPVGGCGSIPLWKDTLNPFQRYEVHILDSDRKYDDEPLSNDKKNHLTRANDRRFITILQRREMENYLSEDSIYSNYLDINNFSQEFKLLIHGKDWKHLDIPAICAESAHNASESPVPWPEVTEENRKSKEGKAKKRLARAFSSETVLLSDFEQDSDLVEALKKIIEISRQ